MECIVCWKLYVWNFHSEKMRTVVMYQPTNYLESKIKLVKQNTIIQCLSKQGGDKSRNSGADLGFIRKGF